jgi:hypothetical protein
MMIPSDLFCIVCGYNQRGLEQARCPECGSEHARFPPSPVRIPWAHRCYFGRCRTFWATVVRATFFPGRIAGEIEHPVSYSDARRFWAAVILHVFLPMLAVIITVTAVCAAIEPPPNVMSDSEYPLGWRSIADAMTLKVLAPIWVGPTILLGLLLFVIAATGLPSYFCRVRNQNETMHNRAIALSYYATGPLAMLPVAMLAWVAVTLAQWKWPWLRESPWPLLVVGTLGAIILLAYLQCVFRLLLELTRGSASRIIKLAVFLPLAWATAAGVCLVLVPLMVQLCLIYLHIIIWPG